jgi:hypothetical protein
MRAPPVDQPENLLAGRSPGEENYKGPLGALDRSWARSPLAVHSDGIRTSCWPEHSGGGSFPTTIYSVDLIPNRLKPPMKEAAGEV